MALCTGEFFRRVLVRKQKGMDAKITITARDGETGLAKTSLGAFLGWYLDTSPTGYRPWEQGTLSVPEFNQAYDELEPGSGLVLDEAEQLDARRTGSHENVDTSHTWMQQRIREITSFLILPSVAELDSRFERLHNFWIQVTNRGEAKIYAAHIHDFSGEVYYEGLQTLRWPNMDGRAPYEALERKKKQFLDDDGTGNWVREEEVVAEWESKVENAQREMRDRIISSVYENTNLSQAAVGEALPEEMQLGQQRVGQIVRQTA